MADTETETSATGAATVTLKEALTEYVILSRHPFADGDVAWDELRRMKARSAHDAIRKHGQEGTFVAIPARSWGPIAVAAKQTTTLDLKPAT